ncbi:DUF397 domain-containing protein [Saccharopolyspora sp. K220]|uniref:DUF397 domain-containing protein n=1 Tax=Saccharopolyspora soli TaxID=2926618 RepID=UPI001F56EB4B|nr:DUF397 domain-containing protein [Saccharopolyspora soli]MCI2420971.1 DUF397 domain-containing protein [Saccharopolyspora soli]
MTKILWRKSTYSQPNGNCVEVGNVHSGAAIRDTKNRASGFITADPAQWQSFLTAVKNGRFHGGPERLGLARAG